jgi:hypothetical protein
MSDSATFNILTENMSRIVDTYDYVSASMNSCIKREIAVSPDEKRASEGIGKVSSEHS